MPGPSLILHRDLDGLGRAAALQASMKRGEVVRIHHGVYLDAATWTQALPEKRMILRAHAYARITTRRPVFAAITAGAAWGLPLYKVRDTRVHTIEAGPHPATSRSRVFRHRSELPDADTAELDGLRVTSLSRTVFDLIRTLTPEAAVSVMDAALRRIAWRGRGVYDREAAETFRAEVLQRIDAAPGARGIRQARFTAGFGDGRAQLPGESVSRLWMLELGAAEPDLQVRVVLPDGEAFLDFGWRDLRRFGEFDGDTKYLDAALTQGRTASDVLRAQREREAAIIAATGWSPLRWGMDKLATRDVFEALLRAQRLL